MTPVEYMYRRRQSTKSYPQGTQKKNKWYPVEDEKCSCCYSIRAPSNAYPFSYFTHCKTKKHIKNLSEENKTFFENLFSVEVWDILNNPKNIPLHINSFNPDVKELCNKLLKGE